MESRSVFDYLDYREYLSKRFLTFGESRGMRRKLAQALGVADPYVTKILNGNINLSLDHVPVVNKLLEHNREEGEFFFQLVVYTQADSASLKEMMKEKLDTILTKKRMRPDWVSKMDEYPDYVEPTYFSRWYYVVIHILTAIPEFQTNAAIAKRLKLPLGTVNDALDFLSHAGILEKNGDRYKNAKLVSYQPSTSAWINHTHMNIRNLAMQKSAENIAENLHFSGIYAISLKDAELIKVKIRQLLKECEGMFIKKTNEEVFILGIDFFNV